MKLSWLVWLLALALLAASPCFAARRTIALYVVPWVSRPPIIDGQLNDPAWAKVRASATYYKYLDPQGAPGALHSSLRLVYDHHGVYLAITNADPHIAHIRANRMVNGDPNLWTDDCAEIYFIPSTGGDDYRKFTVNSLATHNNLPAWNSDWRVATRVGKKAWTIEAFFPWSTFGGQAHAGSLWRFDHVRYSYSTGTFQGVTWSPGGSYASPDEFGYLLFAGAKHMNIAAALRRLSRVVTPPWQFVGSKGIYFCDAADKIRSVLPGALLRAALAKTVAAWRRVRPTVARMNDAQGRRELAKFKRPIAVDNNLSPAAALQEVHSLNRTRKALNKIYWQARLKALLTHESVKSVKSVDGARS